MSSVISILRRVADAGHPWVKWGDVSTCTADDHAGERAIEAGLLVEAGSVVGLTDSGRAAVERAEHAERIGFGPSVARSIAWATFGLKAIARGGR